MRPRPFLVPIVSEAVETLLDTVAVLVLREQDASAECVEAAWAHVCGIDSAPLRAVVCRYARRHPAARLGFDE